MHGDDVRAWQEFLAAQKIYRGATDGEFDGATEQATFAYQKKSGIHADGEVAQATLDLAEREGFSRLPTTLYTIESMSIKDVWFCR